MGIFRRWKQAAKDESGQVLAGVLLLLFVGGLFIAPCLSHASTGLNSGRVLVRNVSGLYAADAGIADVLWCLGNEVPAHTELPENLNGMTVTMQTEELGWYSLVWGELVEEGIHGDWLVVSSDVVWGGEGGPHEFTITVDCQSDPTTKIFLAKVGVRLPVGFEYQPGSAGLFGDNLSYGEPYDEVDGAGAHLLEWVFSSPRPWVNQSEPTKTQSFYITGTGELTGYYSWTIAAEADIGNVGEISGELYRITAVATSPDTGETVAVIVADVMFSEGEATIVSWRTSSQ